jgi:hypothetical protein
MACATQRRVRSEPGDLETLPRHYDDDHDDCEYGPHVESGFGGNRGRVTVSEVLRLTRTKMAGGYLARPSIRFFQRWTCPGVTSLSAHRDFSLAGDT